MYAVCYQCRSILWTDGRSVSVDSDNREKLFDDSKDDKGAWITETEWFGDPQVVQYHEKSGLFEWKS